MYLKAEAEIMTTTLYRCSGDYCLRDGGNGDSSSEISRIMAECMFSRAAEKLRLYFVLTDATSYSATL